MSVCAAKSKRTDAGAARLSTPYPWFKPGIHVKRAACKIYGRIRLAKMKAGGDQLVLQGKHGLGEAGNTSSGIGVADIGFYRTDGAKILLLRVSAESLGKRRDF